MAAPVAPPDRPFTPPLRHSKPARGRWLRRILVALLLLVIGLAAAGAIGLAMLSRDLPPVSALEGSSGLAFKTSQIFDRTGQLLWEINDPSGGRRTVVPLAEISPTLVQATLAAEDINFYQHQGFDLLATLRSAYITLSGEGQTGGSTITQQLVRNAILNPDEARQTTLRRKLREMILAFQVDMRYSKDQVLELYLNRVYYGNQSYGVEAAAQGYFGKSAREVSLSEAALMAGLVQAPSRYDPTRRDVARTADGTPVEAKDRQRYVLEQMTTHDMITRDQARAAYDERVVLKKREVDLKAPHWVMYVRDQIEQQFGDRTLYEAGLRIFTTLDLAYNERLQEVLDANREVVQDAGGNNIALASVDPTTGEILGFLGSLDYNDEAIDGQVNVLNSERQPGSSIKPVVYAASFLKGWAPGQAVDDNRQCWQDRPGNQWCPNNFDNRFHGQTTVRSALGNSINIPAVKALEFVGIPDAIDLATRMGITTWAPDSGKNVGLSLVLGGAEVRPLDMAQVYATLANNGRKVPLVAVRRVVDDQGAVLLDYQVPQGEQVLDPRAAYMISHILSDPKAKLFTYSRDTPLNFKDRQVASKTGTTDNYRDTWTDGYSPNLAMVVWVGNTNGEPMKQALSSMTAGRIWPQAMQMSFDTLGLPPAEFQRPSGIDEGQVCGDAALRPGEPPCRTDLFFAGQAPKPQPTSAATVAPTSAPEPTAMPEPTPEAKPEPTAPPAVAPTAAPKPAATQPPVPATVAPAKPQPTAAPAAPAKPQPTTAPAAPAKPQPTAAPKPAP